LVQYSTSSIPSVVHRKPLRNAFVLGVQYLAFEAFPIIFMENHGFSMQMTGLTFLGIGIGFLIGLATTPYWDE